MILARAARAAVPLSCGVPLTAHLAAHATDAYTLQIPGEAVTVVDAVDTSGTIGLLKLAGPDSADTCTGTLEVSGEEPLVEVSDCIGDDTGNYTISAHVVSDEPANCSLPLPCEATPRVRQLKVAGAVDAYDFPGQRGDRITLSAGDVTGAIGNLRVRLYGPDGQPVLGGDSCSGLSNFMLPQTGTYTVLISACGLPRNGPYSITFQSPACPAGPDITFFGLARSDGSPVSPATFDAAGRPVYTVRVGSGFFLVLEAQPGSSDAPVGTSAFNYNPGDPTQLPDLQVLFARPLGDGSPVVCDKSLPNPGGVPAIAALDFTDSPLEANAINDFGCRVNNGAGMPLGVPPADACTLFPDGTFHFVSSASTIQFCAEIDHPWAFPGGLTTVAARVRDVRGFAGAPREIAVHVGPNHCAADCNGDFRVTIDELVLAVNIALQRQPLQVCSAADTDGDGAVTVGEIVAAVAAALNGCS